MLVGGHPVAGVEAGEVYRAGEGSQSALAAKIEINLEIAEGQFAQGAVEGLAVAAAAEVGFGDRSPVTANAVDRHYVVGVVFGFEIDDQWRIPIGAKGGGGQGCGLEAGRGV